MRRGGEASYGRNVCLKSLDFRDGAALKQVTGNEVLSDASISKLTRGKKTNNLQFTKCFFFQMQSHFFLKLILDKSS